MDTTFERKYFDREGTVEWFTPVHIVKSLGEFDLDPCTSELRPFDIAKENCTIEKDGLKQVWGGRVWCNPPYGKETGKWLEKLFDHGNGIALIFARVETKMFFDYVWNRADAVIFLKGRLKFINTKGLTSNSAGAPSCLIAYGKENVEALENSGLKGKIIKLR
jgi:hypothetical protein